ncbi:hypothetical protein SAMN05421595_0189 [Austwickia chelonae]|uniref:EamA domain-containing protein n=1 Tax=Austwickia chelonae NBRC 105200 TaxID=1184607 RepID=K6V9R3_9MICO|nr:hypothetical protein [Austwickia chelonae]GAB78973.1 hypothetical protein AUCHE_17_01890 [Austwickia chelonae NBRC 105200]SEV87597.1 hypothetical protein SAMN05421595_0189 [Austwickia chelonae]
MKETTASENSFLFVLVVVTAVILQGVGASFVGNTISPKMSAFTVFVAFAVAEMLGAASRLGTLQPKHQATFRNICLINVYTAGAFVLLYLSMTLTLPTAASVVETAVAPVLFGLSSRGRRSALPSVSLYLIAVAVVAFLVLSASTGSPFRTAAGLLVAAGAGLCALGVIRVGRRLGKQGCSTWYINSIRFHGCWVAAAALFALSPGENPPSGADLATIVAVALIGITAPVVLFQYGITRTPVRTTAFVVSVLPAVVFCTDLFVFGVADPLVAVPLACVLAAAWLGIRKTEPAAAEEDTPQPPTGSEQSRPATAEGAEDADATPEDADAGDVSPRARHASDAPPGSTTRTTPEPHPETPQ